MNEKQRAERTLEALASIDTALADLEDAAYGKEGDIGDDGLFHAVTAFIDAYGEACDKAKWTLDGKPIPNLRDEIIREAGMRQGA